MKRQSTQMPLRVPEELHKDLKAAAAAEGLSLNQYCLYLLARHGARSEELARRKGEELLRFWEEAAVLQAQLEKDRESGSESAPIETPSLRWERLYGDN